MEMTTTAAKSERNGWEAKTIIALPGVIEKTFGNEAPAPAQLEITTGKHYDGGIRSRATVVYRTAHGFRTAIGMGAGCGDYSRGIMSDPKARCTEKKVKEFHAQSLTHIELVLAGIRDHYGVADLFTAPAMAEA